MTSTRNNKAKSVADEIANKPKSMGSGVLSDPSLKFCHKFRWTMESDKLPSHFFKRLGIDYVNRVIEFEYYDVIVSENEGMHALVWVDLIQNRKVKDELKFTSYDGCGTELYNCVFSGLSIKKHDCDFDYDDSDLSVQRITVSYENVEKYIVSCNHCETKTNWKVQVFDRNGVAICEPAKAWVQSRPNLRIETKLVRHLNAQVIVPGKASWDAVKLGTELSVRSAIAQYGSAQNLQVKLFLCEDDEVKETWTLSNAVFSKMLVDDDKVYLDMSYSSAQYMPATVEQ